MDDSQTLTEFAQSKSEDVFARLVSRHVPLVYSACLRQLKSPAQADAATRAVFLLLKQRATALKATLHLAPWLYDAARQVCRDMSRLAPPADLPATIPGAIYSVPTDWANLGPKVDDALASLPTEIRHAVLLKYVVNLPVREVARALNLADRAAGQRISAGVARMRRHFESQNLFLPADALVAAIQAHAVQPAPSGVAYNATLAALTDEAAPAAIAARVSASQKRRKILSTASLAAAVLLVALIVPKFFSALKAWSLAATQPAPTTLAAHDPIPPPASRPIPPPEKPAPPIQPERVIPAELTARFILAVKQSDYETVLRMVEDERSLVNARDITGRSAISIAAELVFDQNKSATRIAHFLIDFGAKVDVHTAARAGHEEQVVRLLFAAPRTLDAKDAQGLTALQRAALIRGSSPECEKVADRLISFGAKIDLCTAATLARLDDVKQALEADPAAINTPVLGASPLNWAARPRRYSADPLAIPRLLIEKGADIKSPDTGENGMTPLHHAAEWGAQPEFATLLIEKGLDVNSLDDFGLTPLDYALDRGRKEMIDILTPRGARRTTVDHPDQPIKTARFFATVQSADAEGAKRLLDDTPELAKSRGPTGETPMHHAAAIGSIAIIDLLLADHAEINAHETNKFGGTPLHWAVRHDQLQTVNHLLAKGADPKLLNQRSKQSLLHVAAQHTDDLPLLELLLAKGLDPAAKDRFDRTPLDYARQGGNTKIAGRLQR